MAGFFRKLFGRSSRGTEDVNLLIGDLKVGALYSVFNGDESGDFGIVKILALESPIVHIRVYSNRFSVRPEHVDLETLSLGIESSAFEKALEEDNVEEMSLGADFGIGHMPIHLRDFVYGWQPIFLIDSPVTEEELEGYRIWSENGGGVFGG